MMFDTGSRSAVPDGADVKPGGARARTRGRGRARRAPTAGDCTVIGQRRPEGITIEDASYLKMKGNYEVGNILREKHGEKITVMSLGQAGEMRLTAASIAVTDPEGRPTRHCGRGGTGAVLGSKGIKAIVIDPGKENKVEYHNIDNFRAAARSFSKSVLAHPVSGQGLPAYGTAVLVNVLNEAGGLPTDNFRDGRFEFAENVNRE